MAKVYRCEQCDREFILDGEDIAPGNPKITVPYCPYCGRKSGNGIQATVFYLREQ